MRWCEVCSSAEFHFGDAPKWWHYGEDRDDETASDEEDEPEATETDNKDVNEDDVEW